MTMTMFKTTALAAGFLTFALGFAACEKDGLDTASDPLALILAADDDGIVDAISFQTEALHKTITDEHFAGDREHRFHGDCFSLVFPVDVAFPDGSIVTVDSAGGIRAAVEAYVAAHPNRERPRVRPTFVFPIDVQLADGTIRTVESPETLRELAKACRPEPTPCATLVFPISFEIGGTVRTFGDAAALRAGLSAYKMSGAITKRSHMVFPVQLELESGEVVSANSVSELQLLQRRCSGKASHGASVKDCFKFGLPLQVETTSGTLTINTETELRRALSHAGPKGRAHLVYPLNVTLADGSVVAVASPADLLAVKRGCK